MYVINTFHSDFFAVYYRWSDLSFDDSQRFLQIHIHTFVLKRNKHYFNKEQLNKFYRELHISFSAKKHQPKRRNSIFFDKRLLFFAKTTRPGHQRGRWRIIFIVKEKRKSHRTILKIFHLTIPLKIYYHDGGLQYDQSDESRSSGYSMVKVPLYLSADKVDKDNDDGHRKYFDINLAVY